MGAYIVSKSSTYDVTNKKNYFAQFSLFLRIENESMQKVSQNVNDDECIKYCP